MRSAAVGTRRLHRRRPGWSFSLVQSANGIVADSAATACRHGTYTFCDVTQAAGVLPVDASLFDVTVCHAYKWLCSPRGVAFLTLSERFEPFVTPLQAGWYAGEDVWRSTYGPEMHLAHDVRRFDVSPAWQAWVGAEQSLALFAGIPQQRQAIVTWPDESGRDLGKLVAAGVRASGRAGRLRASFHLWNDASDVDAVVAALRS